MRQYFCSSFYLSSINYNGTSYLIEQITNAIGDANQIYTYDDLLNIILEHPDINFRKTYKSWNNDRNFISSTMELYSYYIVYTNSNQFIAEHKLLEIK